MAMRFGRMMFVTLVVASGVAGWVGRGVGRVEAMDRAVQTAGQKTLPGVTTLQVYSRETVVDVVVTDDAGKPVLGLKQSEFTVKEDGKEQAIRSFKESGVGVKAVERVALPKLPANVYSNVQATPASGPVNMILLDFTFSDLASSIYMKQAAMKYLKAMPQGTEVAVFTLSGSLRLLQGFTSDGSAAAASIEPLEFDTHGRPIAKLGSAAADAALISPSRANSATAPTMPADTHEAMNQIAAYVSGIKGRKNLMWFTEHIPFSCLLTTDRDIAEFFDAITAAQVAVYPVDQHGLYNDPSFNMASPPKAITERTGAHTADAQMGFLMNTGCNQMLMEAVAVQTGGVAYYNSNDLEAEIGKVVDHGSHSYTLSYVPPQFADDARYHTIEIKVNRPGLHLVYRKGFTAQPPAHPAASPGPKLMQASMGPGVPPATQLLFDVRVQPSMEARKASDPPVMGLLDPKLKDAALTRYGFLYLLPMSQVGFEDTAGGTHSGSVEFDVVVFDADGKQVTLQSQTMKLPLSAEEYGEFVKTPFQFFQEVDLPPGQFTVRVGVLDEVSNKAGTMEVPLTVGKAVAARAGGR